jgi:hypothetical protein
LLIIKDIADLALISPLRKKIFNEIDKEKSNNGNNVNIE